MAKVAVKGAAFLGPLLVFTAHRESIWIAICPVSAFLSHGKFWF